mmetsp:Transcript_21715/g.60225  ORF Transcript_21715/g.60225 Transcript_21715/m.60225 type:complete len:219 (-) Transcript_21715:270-926(-)
MVLQLHHSDADVLNELGVQLPEVVMDHVIQLGSHLDSRGPSSHDDERQQALTLLWWGLGQRSTLKTLAHTMAQIVGILDGLEEIAVLLDAPDPKRVVHAADPHDQHIVGDLEAGFIQAAVRWKAAHQLLLHGVNVLAHGFVELALAHNHVAHRLHDGPLLHGARGHSRQKRGVQEIVARAHQQDLIGLTDVGRERLDETHSTPSRAQDYQARLPGHLC